MRSSLAGTGSLNPLGWSTTTCYGTQYQSGRGTGSNKQPKECVMRRSMWWTLAVLGVAQCMVVLDATVVNVALPKVQTALSFSPSNLTWVISAYTLTFGGFLLFGGRVADLIGRRTIFLTGVGVFTV